MHSVESLSENTVHSITEYRRALVSPAGFYIVLTMLVLGWNCFQSDQARFAFAATSDANLIQFDPEMTSAVLASIDQYTPLVDEGELDLAQSTIEGVMVGFADTQSLDHPFVTEPTKLEQTYEVQGGDTITGIADSFGLHVATIAERNGIAARDIESIQQGTALIIPAEDTSDSTEWLVQLNAEKERQRLAAEDAAKKKSRQALARGTTKVRSSTGYSGVAGMNFSVPIAHNGISRRLQRGHYGIDYRASTGTSVKAAQTGRVIEVTGGWAGGFGNSIVVDHGGGVMTRYAHLSRVATSVGSDVSKGEVIGYSGNTGFSTGPHLHFETRVGGRAVDPF